MFYINNNSKFIKPVPAVMWSIHPSSQLITLRPTWDPYTKLILPKKLEEYYSYGQMVSLVKLIKQSGLYPPDSKLLPIVKRNLAFFREGYFYQLGRNVIIDPWYSDKDSLAAINYYQPFMEYPELPKTYDKRKRPIKP